MTKYYFKLSSLRLPFPRRVRRRRTVAALFVAAATTWPGVPATAAETEPIAGPIEAAALRVLDGDTIEVRARIWLGIEVTTLVRLDGIDTPERRGRCAAERELAERARDFVAARVGGAVLLFDVRHDKYAERVLARVATPDGADLGAALVAAGLARTYDGGAREGWCGAQRST